MLQVNNIFKSYGSLQVLKGVSFAVQPGEMVAIVGPSGAGKSTLLHIAGTLDNPDQGNISFDNQDISKLSARQLARFRNANIGFIFQFHNLLPEFTALENVLIPGLLRGEQEKTLRTKAMDWLSRLGMADRAEHKPSELSGGEQQRVAVARALINSPKVIFADEPSGSLDSKNAGLLHQLFLELKQDLGQTFVMVTHNEKLAQLADRQLLMQDGLLVSEQTNFL
jgi:lipoprotein-releasing system ATP-binding protein